MTGTSIPLANREIVERCLDYPSLIDAIRRAFLHPPITPQRMAIPLPDRGDQPGGTVLLMPSLQPAGLLGVKIISIQPRLSERPGGATRAIYVALDAKTGELKGLIDGHALTLRRTAATSMLAAQILSVPNPKTVLVIGTGSLAEALARAYAETFHPDRILIWGRRESKAQALADRLAMAGIAAEAKSDLAKALASTDIVTSATLARDPIIQGRHLREGTHVDLVGGFTREMREADDDLISRGVIVADTDTTMSEAGDLAQPLEKGVIQKAGIATLGQVLSGERLARTSRSDVTIFKSAGHALEDLAAAQLLFQRWSSEE